MQRTGKGPSSQAAPRLLFLAGLVLSGLMLARSQVGGDQLNLLTRGWLLAGRGELVPYGNPTSTGGVEPGAATSLLVGLPLFVWSHHRAPVLLILLGHVAGYLLLDRVVREVLGDRGRWLLAILYWLNPWRLYHAAFLWNPNFLIPLGALHCWSSFRLRGQPRAGVSFFHGLALAIAVQLHPSALILGLVSLGLCLRGHQRPHWRGLAGGALVGSLSLVPWLLLLTSDLSLNPVGGGRGFPGRGLVLVFPVIKGLLYWFRYSSLLLPQSALTFDFVALDGPGASVMEGLLAGVVGGLGIAGVALTAVATLRLWRRPWKREKSVLRRGRPSRWRVPWEVRTTSSRGWLRAYTGWSLLATLGAFALSPTTPQSWQALIVLHAAVIPVLLLADAWLDSPRHRGLARTAIGVHLAASLCVAVIAAFASPHFRCGGRGSLRPTVGNDFPMLHELGIHETCAVTIVEAAEP